ncbi:MAG TPA: 4Fe-4S binding protein [Syntrophobacteraceae bacterium]|nr:4Fe-4S binding protein [Syntrophobacteraceae bacterium]
MASNDIYEKIAETFEFPGSKNLIKYLKVLFKPEEGKLLLEFLKPATCSEVAKRLKVDEKVLSEKLAELKRRRLLFHKHDKYLFHIAMHGFFARIAKAKKEDIPEGFWKAWDDFMPEVEKQMITRSIKVAKQIPVSGIMTRIIPARLALDSNPNIKPEEILPEEDVHALLRMKGSQEVIAVSDCDCRIRAHKCDRPTLNCFEFGKYAEFNLNQSSSLKVVSVEEAIAISDEAERAGLLKSGGIRKENGGVLCHCCDDCCNVMGATIRNEVAHQLRNPSRYRARVNSESCKGCQTCVDRCFFGAIEMAKVPGSKRLKASLNEEKCMGCGLCVIGCEQKALIFDLVKPPEYLAIDREESASPFSDGKGPVWGPFTTAP